MQNNNIVDVISLGTPCSRVEIQAIKNFLTLHNFRANIFLEEQTTIANKLNHEFPIIDPKYRFMQLSQALENPNSQIIWCSRGGYGSAEVVDYLYSMNRPNLNKIFIGFSDISSINIFLEKNWQYPTITAPTLIQCAYEMVSVESIAEILSVVKGNKNFVTYQLTNLSNFEFGEITGILTGGCISVLTGNFATKNQIDWHNKILFLEDEGEDGERLDRYFHQISTMIKETHNKPVAIILGNFLQSNPHGSPKADNIEIAIARFVHKLVDIPIFQDKNFYLGHSFEMKPISIGLVAKINKENIFNQRLF
jgi:muramoyltetrapeptide carboxypeptidase